MYSQEDIRSAVAAGAISQDAADALRHHVAASREAVPADAEHFRLITGFNDIFVTIGIVIMLVAAAAIGMELAGDTVASLLVAGTAWGLAEFFTRKRRMALPSIVLLLAFLGGIYVAMMTGLEDAFYTMQNDSTGALLIAAVALVTTGAAWLHWRRFMVPITIAAGTAAAAGTIISLIMALLLAAGLPEMTTFLTLVFMAGLAVFAFAMRWDIGDPARETRRSDVAFWLHLLAAPMLAHPLFSLIGVTGGVIGIPAAIGVLVIYVAFGMVALAVDRRALLVSALAYVLFALAFLLERFGAVELAFALTALVIGSALLTLSAFWSPIRRVVVEMLPENWQKLLPATLDEREPIPA